EHFAVAVVEAALPDDQKISLLQLLKAGNGQIRVIMSTASAGPSAKDTVEEGVIPLSPPPDSPLEWLKTIRRVCRDQMIHYTRELEKALADRTAELEEREERLRQLAHHIKEVFWIAAPDHSEIYYISPLYETVWGQSCSSL